MTDETIVAVYDTAAHAEAAVADLRRAGVPDHCIRLHAEASGAAQMAGATTAAPRPEGFWANLFGGEPDHDTAVYERSVAGGATVLSVGACETDLLQVLRILEDHDPIDIDERASGYSQTQPVPPVAATTAGAAGGSETLRLAEESLAVGKRVVNRGGTRIRRFVVETPVAQDVTLRDERVTLERRPVTGDRAVEAADFGERTVEMTATAEEAVVSKSARVYEEVALRKEATQRTETIRDTVRKEEVEVEQVPGHAADTGDALRPKV